MDKEVKIDYFAVSLPDLLIFDDNLNDRNKVQCLFLKGLGHLGLGDNRISSKCFEDILLIDCAHLGAKSHLKFV